MTIIEMLQKNDGFYKPRIVFIYLEQLKI
jgi:hypothetical protein